MYGRSRIQKHIDRRTVLIGRVGGGRRIQILYDTCVVVYVPVKDDNTGRGVCGNQRDRGPELRNEGK